MHFCTHCHRGVLDYDPDRKTLRCPYCYVEFERWPDEVRLARRLKLLAYSMLGLATISVIGLLVLR